MAYYKRKSVSRNKVPAWVGALGVLVVFFMFIEGKFVSLNVQQR